MKGVHGGGAGGASARPGRQSRGRRAHHWRQPPFERRALRRGTRDPLHTFVYLSIHFICLYIYIYIYIHIYIYIYT